MLEDPKFKSHDINIDLNNVKLPLSVESPAMISYFSFLPRRIWSVEKRKIKSLMGVAGIAIKV